MRRGQQSGQYYPRQQEVTSFGNLSYTENIPEYVGLPMDDIIRASADMHQRGTENRLKFDELLMSAEQDLQNVRQEHTQDRNIIIDRVNKIGDTINQYVEGGNFHRADLALSKTLREYINDPLRVAAITAKEKQEAYKVALKELELPSSYEKKALEISNGEAFNAPITVDEEGNIKGGFTPFTPAKYVEHQGLIKEFFDNFSSYVDKNSMIGPSEEGGISMGMWDIDKAGLKPYLEKYDVSSTGLSEDRVVSAINNFLTNHDGYTDWMESKYVMDHYDSKVGDIVTPDATAYASRLALKKYNPDKTPRPPEDLLDEGLTVLEGRIAKIRDRYFDVNKEPLDYDLARDMAYKEFYMEDERMGHISGLGGKYIHEARTFSHDIRKDDLYHGRAKATSDLLFNVHPYSGENADIELLSIIDNISQSEELIESYDKQLENLNNQLDLIFDEDERERLQEEITQIEELHTAASANRNLKSAVLDNIMSNATPQQKYEAARKAINNSTVKSFIPFAGGQFYSPSESAELMEIVIKEGVDAAHKYIIDSLTGRQRLRAGDLRAVPLSERQIMNAADKFVRAYQKEYSKALGEEGLSYHTNKFVIIPSGGHMARMQASLEEGLKYKRDSFVSIDGRVSSTDKDIQKIIDESDDVKVTFLSDTVGSNLEVLVSYYNGGKLLKSYIAESSMLQGISSDFANEIIIGSENPAYAHNPAYASKLRQMGQGLFVALQPVTLGGATMTMRDAVKSLNMEAWSTKVDKNTNPEPIVITHNGKDLPLTFEKRANGYILSYVDADGVKKTITKSGKPYPTPESAFMDLYEYLTTPNTQIEEYA